MEIKMINNNTIIKFSDYRDIYIINNDCFVYRIDKKIYNIKGENVEKYILPIYCNLFQPNYIIDLFENIKRYFCGKKYQEITQEAFLEIILKLYNLGIIEVVDKNRELQMNDKLVDYFKNIRSKDDDASYVSKINITILNFMNCDDIILLLKELEKMQFKTINLINLYPDILDINTETILSNNDITKLNINYVKISDIYIVCKEISQSDFLLVIHTANNIELNSYINKCILSYNIPVLRPS